MKDEVNRALDIIDTSTFDKIDLDTCKAFCEMLCWGHEMNNCIRCMYYNEVICKTEQF